MDIVNSLEYLQRDLKERIAWQTRRLGWERGKALALKTLAVILAAGITVLLGLEGGVVGETTAKNLALVFGAVIVVLNAWEAFFDHRGLWIMHTTNRARLDALAGEIDFYLAGHSPEEMTEDDAERFARRSRDMGKARLTRWLRLHDQGAGPDADTPAPPAPPNAAG